ncbi:MAG: hypothetical protein PHS77_07215 [Gallionellaceae bacterium]|nr:hypothetical protein [Gallionellaceae bacterium]
MGHLACYIQSGRRLSAHQALVLLGKLEISHGRETELGEHSRLLREVIEDKLAQAPDNMAHARNWRPWAAWKNLRGAL